MSSRLVVFVLATLVGWTAELGATLIVTYRSANEIIIAADSLRTINTAQPTRVLACKIRNFGDVVFAASGSSSRPGGVFSLDAITQELHQTNVLVPVPLWNRIVKFDQGTIAAFNKVHNERSETSPISFTYILGFMLEGRPLVYSRTLKSSGGAAEIGRPEELPESEILFTGQPDIVDHLSSVSILDDQGPVVSLSSLFARVIDYQAQRTPTKVGGPVDIIRLTANGTEWLQRQPQCRDRE